MQQHALLPNPEVDPRLRGRARTRCARATTRFPRMAKAAETPHKATYLSLP
jgi:hypothetical protein